MSKQPPQPADDAAPPPSYTESLTAGPAAYASPLSPPPSSGRAATDPALYTSHLSAHLSGLPSRLRAAHHARTTERQSRDLYLITLLVPEIESFLSDIGDEASAPPPVAELTLVPGGAVGRGWVLSGARERRREGETVQLVRVCAPVPPAAAGEKGGERGEKGKQQRKGEEKERERDWDAVQFDEWGRWEDEGSDSSADGAGSSWWWRDEAMARRLAGYIQPQTAVKTERREVAAAVQQVKEEKRSWGWGRKKSDAKAASPTAWTAPRVEARRPSAGDGVSMVVKADEVTFKRENDMGIWESRSGWGLVVTVRIRSP